MTTIPDAVASGSVQPPTNAPTTGPLNSSTQLQTDSKPRRSDRLTNIDRPSYTVHDPSHGDEADEPDEDYEPLPKRRKIGESSDGVHVAGGEGKSKGNSHHIHSNFTCLRILQC